MLAALLAFVALGYGLERALSLDEPLSLGPISALLMASIPAAIWLSYFYSQNRLENEPKSHVLGSFILGAFVAGPSASFLVDIALGGSGHSVSLNVLALERWVAAIAIIGVAQEACKYSVIRYSLYLSPELDEPVDGIIYLSAAAIGFATYESLSFLHAAGAEIYLSSGIAHCVVTALAHLSFAGILGYALGRAKFASSSPGRRRLQLAAGLIAAALLNGSFHMIHDALSVQGSASSPWRPVLFSFGLAAGVFLLTSILVRRFSLSAARGSSRAQSDEASSKDAEKDAETKDA